MELRIIILYGIEIPLHSDLRIKLLPDLTNDGLLRCLIRFHLAAWELPAVLEVTVATLGGEYLVSEVLSWNCPSTGISARITAATT